VPAIACTRRGAIAAAAAALAAVRARAADSASAIAPERRWYDAADAQRRAAESWGDQPYGAVVVLQGAVVGEGPSRVVRHRDPDAHAEREAIKDAQRRLGRTSLNGATLYSTSRPCALCEAAAARAGIGRMVFGAELTDAGPPRLK
jgi:tRNA(adenine34) deaminase